MKKLFARNRHQKICKDEARYLYDSLIKPDVDTLEKSKSRGKDKRNNILTGLTNIETSIFDGAYFHYCDKPSEPVPESEESIAKRMQLRKQGLNEITKKETKTSFKLFERYIDQVLNKTKNSEENKAQVNIIENRLANLKEVLTSRPTSNVKKLKTEITC